MATSKTSREPTPNTPWLPRLKELTGPVSLSRREQLLGLASLFAKAISALLVSATQMCGQSGHAPSFDVASVKPNTRDEAQMDVMPRRFGNRVTMHNANLNIIIAWAYHLTNSNYQLVANRWEKNLWDSYDIDALTPSAVNGDGLRSMFRALLEDRFQLQLHRETRELPAYNLVVIRSGSKLTPTHPGSRKVSLGFGGSASWVEFRSDGKHLTGQGATTEELAVVLTRQMNAPVRDRTRSVTA
jgi:uncharacterized protein (TIGR03435 family)